MVNGHFPVNNQMLEQNWLPWAVLMGCLFISLFNLIAWIAQRIGVAVASVANKMSLVVPFLFSLYLYNENVTSWQIAGIGIALAAVLLTCWPQKKSSGPDIKATSPLLLFLMPAVLFAGSGLLDTLLKYVEQTFLHDGNKNDYLITSFGVAAILGSVLLAYLFISGRQRFNRRSVLAGIIIGVPNYFSIWCLVRVLKEYQGQSSAIIPINNMGIVLFSSLAAFLLFKEKLSLINWMGILLAIGAIALIAFG
jgi:drug/metabolite transporter (DMT)-like permease